MNVFQEFYGKMGILYADYYKKYGEQKGIDFMFKSYIAMYVLHNIYKNSILDGMCAIENISKDQKEKYWNLTEPYFTETEDRIRASKIVYLLELITT